MPKFPGIEYIVNVFQDRFMSLFAIWYVLLKISHPLIFMSVFIHNVL